MPADLVTTTEVTNAQPAAGSLWSTLGATEQAALVAAASRAIEQECDRVLGLASHDELHRPGRTRKIYLREYPLVSIQRIATDLLALCTIQCTLAAASRATITFTVSTAGTGPDEPVATGIQLDSVASGITTTTPLLFGTYTTLGALATAIQAVTGWTATVATGYDTWATADLNLDAGPRDARLAAASLYGYTRDLSRYAVRWGSGVVELTDSIRDGFRFPDRAWSLAGDPADSMVRVRYTAGYATADVPADLKRACIQLINATAERDGLPGVRRVEQAGMDRIELADLPSGPVGLIRSGIGGYVRRRIA